MKKEHLLAILLFSGLWGISEAVLGDALYTASVPYASVYLTAIAFFLLAAARSFVPWTGSATVIGLLAMLYKLINVPFFACHLSAIALLGVSFDAAWAIGSHSVRQRGATGYEGWARNGQASVPLLVLRGVVACYLGHLFFILAMVYGFRSEYWLEKGFVGAAQHVGVAGSLAAIGCAVMTPLGARLGARWRDRAASPARQADALQVSALRPAGLAGIVVSAALWIYGVTGHFLRS